MTIKNTINVNSFTDNLIKQFLLNFSNFKSLLPLNLPKRSTVFLFDWLHSHLFQYPTPISLTYAWSFGSLAGLSLVIQIISGVFLSMFYVPHVDYAFNSIEFIMREVKNGWLIRYIHSNGASMFFIVVYAHMCRGLYYGSYMKPREALWCSGVVLFILIMGTAFTGYVLPWGQMSFWGATVITSMVTIVPVAGTYIIEWLWGGYVINNNTLKRFFTLHFILPLIIAGVTLIHLALLHRVGSSSPIGSDTGVDDVPFYPYYFSKDTFALCVYLLVFATFVFYYPNVLNHPDNYIPADSMETPAHVVPEWYFLPFYAMLRSIPHKALGIITMGGSIAILFLLPVLNTSYIRNTTFRPIFRIFFWLFIADFIILMWLGQQPVRKIFIFVGQIATISYFIFFGAVPIIGKVETFLAHYKVKN